VQLRTRQRLRATATHSPLVETNAKAEWKESGAPNGPGGDQIKAQEHFLAVQEGRIFSHTRWAQVAGHAFAGLFLFAAAGPSVYLQFCMTGGSPEGQNSSPNTSYEFQLANFACPSRKKKRFQLVVCLTFSSTPARTCIQLQYSSSAITTRAARPTRGAGRIALRNSMNGRADRCRLSRSRPGAAASGYGHGPTGRAFSERRGRTRLHKVRSW